MTRRERLENRAERRREWAAGRERKATAAFQRAHDATAGIPFGQPILVGHHSEKRHRAAIARSDSAVSAAVESSHMAEHHESKADGIERQLERSIFSDDPDAIEALEAKAAALEAERDRMKDINKAIRKAFKTEGMTLESFAAGNWIEPAVTAAELAELVSLRRVWGSVYAPGFPAYSLTNLGGNIRRARERIEQIKRRNARTERAEAAGGVVIEGNEYVRVTFAEKPEREILNALRSADFHWGSGSWSGRRDKLPECLKEQPAE